jgi:hypothetical protein
VAYAEFLAQDAIDAPSLVLTLSETEGVFADTGGGGHDGTPTGTMTRGVPGFITDGPAALHLHLGAAFLGTEFDMEPPCSVEFWADLTESTTQLILCKRTNFWHEESRFLVIFDGGIFLFGGHPGYAAFTGHPFAAGPTGHVLVTATPAVLDGEGNVVTPRTARLYRNKVLVDTQPLVSWGLKTDAHVYVGQVGWADPTVLFPGVVGPVRAFPSALSAARVAARYDAAVAPAGGASVDLVAQGGRASATAASGALTQDHALTAQGAGSSPKAAAGSLVQVHQIVAQGGRAAATSATGALTLDGDAYALVGHGARSSSTSAVATLNQVHALTVAGGRSSSTSATATLTQAHELAAAGGRASTTAGQGDLSLSVLLVATGARTSPTAGTGALAQTHALAAQGGRSGLAAAAAALAQAHVLVAHGARSSARAADGSVADETTRPADVALALSLAHGASLSLTTDHRAAVALTLAHHAALSAR